MVEEKKHKLKDLLLSENEPRYALTTTVSSKEQIYISGLQAIFICKQEHPSFADRILLTHIKLQIVLNGSNLIFPYLNKI